MSCDDALHRLHGRYRQGAIDAAGAGEDAASEAALRRHATLAALIGFRRRQDAARQFVRQEE